MENKTQIEYEFRRDSANDTFKISSWGVRHTQCVLLLFALTISYSMRSCMGVALVAMVHHLPTLNHSQLISTQLLKNTLNETQNDFNETMSIENHVEDDFEFNGFFNSLLLTPPFPRFRWAKKVQDAVISSFFWGYMTLQIPGGQLAHRFGARYLLVGSLSANFFTSMIFPIAAYYGGWPCAVVCRLFQGLTQASVVPSIHTHLGKWSPLEERGRLSAIINGGQALGAVLGLPMTGFLSSSVLGWPGIFRFYGLLSGIMAVFLWFLVADTPATHPRISRSERRYIEEALRQTGPRKKLPIPWKKILTSPGMLAIVASHIGFTWSQLVLYSEVPAYMDNVMGINIKANGLLTALPFMLMWFANFFFSWIFDMMIVRKYLNVTQTRKLATTVGSVPAAIGLILLGFAPNNIYIVETLLVFICVFKVAGQTGFYVNHVDISPNYAGTMMSISNFASNLVGCQAPLIAGVILTDVSDASLWRIIFFISAGIYFFTNVAYVVWGTGELADWNEPPQYEKLTLTDCEDNKEKLMTNSVEETNGVKENGVQ